MKIILCCCALTVLLVLSVTGCGRGPASDPADDPAGDPASESTPEGSPGEVLVTADGRFPTVAADVAAGVAYVAWAATTADGDGTDILVARIEGREASAPVRVNAEPGRGGAHDQAPPSVAVGPDGAVYVAYIVQTTVEGRRFPASDVFLARSTDGARTFEAPVQVNEDAGYPTGHHFHDLDVGPDGVLYVSWLDSSASDRGEAARHGVEATGASHGKAMHPAGGPGTQLRIARSTNGGRSFEPSVLVAQKTCECCRTALATGPDGTVYVGWRHLYEAEAGGTIRDIAVARSTDGGRSFSAPERVHADGWRLDGCPHAGPALAADEAGRLHTAWFTGAEGRMGTYYAVADDGLHFGEPRPLVADPSSHGAGYRAGSHLALTALGNGEVEAAWEEAVEQHVLVAHVEGGDPAGGGGPIYPDVTLAGSYPVVAASGPVGFIAFTRGDSLLVWTPPLREAPPSSR